MQALVLHQKGKPLALEQRPVPQPGPGQVLLRVLACAVCRTDLHVVDGDLPDPNLPLVPGHEIVGVVQALGPDVSEPAIGQRVGVGWLGHTCGHCRYCLHDRENLCDEPGFTGYTRDGGFATHVLADASFCLPLSASSDPVHTAPLLCAGLIGWRALKAAGPGRNLGLYGFGAAAHLIAQVAIRQGRQVYAFTRPGDGQAQEFARELGASWAAGSDQKPPVELDAAILFAPVGELVPLALAAVRKGGRVVCGGIHMSDIPSFPYSLLWQEREIVSVANLTRSDGKEFLELVGKHPLQVHAIPYPLSEANQALDDLRQGRLRGAAVLVP